MTSTSPARGATLATQFAEIALATPVVVAHRMQRMAMAGVSPSARDRQEFGLMGSEKLAAFSESWTAMARHALVANQALAASMVLAMWSPLLSRRRSPGAMASQMQNAALQMAGKGLAPVHRTVVANARRLAGGASGRAPHR